jgi:hypothetical protein
LQIEPQGRGLIYRMVGAALLKRDVYQEVEMDTGATSSAALVVVLVSLAGGVGAYTASGAAGLAAGVIIGIAGWAVWAAITFFIGTRLLPTPETHANWGQLARTLGFAQTPGLLMVFAVIPAIAGLVVLVVVIWRIVAMVVAVRQALNYQSPMRAVGVVLLGIIPYAIFSLIVVSITAPVFGAEAVGLPPVDSNGA